jgi:hypothetical protein
METDSYWKLNHQKQSCTNKNSQSKERDQLLGLRDSIESTVSKAAFSLRKTGLPSVEKLL